MVLENKEEIPMPVGISKNLAISKRMRGIVRETIEPELNNLLNYYSISRAVIMTSLALSVQKRSEEKIGFGPANAAASQCILNASKHGSTISTNN